MSVSDSKAKNICIVLTSALIAVLSIILLVYRLLAGSDFVLLNLGNAILTLIVWHMPKIAEFSIAGNHVRLKDTLDEAEEITASLKALRRVMMKQFLTSMKINNGNTHQVVRGFFNYASIFNEIVHQPEFISEINDELLQITEQLLGYSAEFFSSGVQGRLSTLSLIDIEDNLASIEMFRNRAFNSLTVAEHPSPGTINAAHFGELTIILYRQLENIKARNHTPIPLPGFDELAFYRYGEPLHRPSVRYRLGKDNNAN